MFKIPVMLMLAFALLQEPTTTQPQPQANNNVLLIVCDAEPSKFILLDSDGKWLSSVREAKINYTLLAQPTIDCVMYDGPFKPSKPKTKTWNIIELKSVSSEEFYGYVDSLQDDPLAIKKMLSKK